MVCFSVHAWCTSSFDLAKSELPEMNHNRPAAESVERTQATTIVPVHHVTMVTGQSYCSCKLMRTIMRILACCQVAEQFKDWTSPVRVRCLGSPEVLSLFGGLSDDGSEKETARGEFSFRRKSFKHQCMEFGICL